MLATLSRTFCCRLLAAFIVVLVVSPYSEPFATMNGTDFGGSGAVDVDGSSSKSKAPAQDVLPPPLPIVTHSDLSLVYVRPSVGSVARDVRSGQRTVLRL